MGLSTLSRGTRGPTTAPASSSPTTTETRVAITKIVPDQRPRCAIPAPAILAEHGIPDFTAYVRSAYADRHGKIVGPTNRTRPAERALQLPFLALNQPNAIRVLALDCDHPDDFRHAIWARKLPQPGIEVWRDGGGLLAVWPLARRVHRGPKARQRPVRLFGRTAEYFTRAAGADPHFNPNGPIRNPAAPHDTWRVIQNGRGGFYLVELHEFLPDRWSLPRAAELVTVAGRNCSLFAALMRFAGRWSSREADLLEEGEAMNAAMFVLPLPAAEVGWITASVDRYRAEWIAEGRYTVDPARQAERGRRSGAVRRRGSNEERQPWKVDGISRATWYRRQRETRTNTGEGGFRPQFPGCLGPSLFSVANTGR